MTSLTRRAAKTSRRHFQRILAILLGVVVVIVVANNLTFNLIRTPKNIGTAQMIYGWARLYKPMIYDSAKPQSIAFGYSWVRDIFDPVKAEALTGEAFFNFGMSGAKSYESFRLLQNALYVYKPKRVFLDIDSFYDSPNASKVEFQFDERILYINRDGSLNPRAKLNRIVKINTSGAALAFNFRFLKTLYRANSGVPLEDLLPSYQRRDWRKRASVIADMRDWLAGRASPPKRAGDTGAKKQPTFVDLKNSIALACAAGVDVFLVETPYIYGGDGSLTRAVLRLAKEMQPGCASKISYTSFRYPNAVTIEGIIGTPRLSVFYRPDGHPRPSLGQMMLTRMLDLEGTKGAPPLPKDFGVNLMGLSARAASEWITRRSARGVGIWQDGELAALIKEAEALTPLWAARY